MRGGALRALVVLTTLPAAAGAQAVSASLDVGTARMTYADSIHATSATVSPAFQLTGHRGTLTGAGTLSQLRGSTTHAGTIEGAFTALSRGALSLEAGGLAGGSAHDNGTRTGQLLASARLLAGSATGGAWAGAGLGRTWDASWRDVLQGDAGAWLVNGRMSFVVGVVPTTVDDTIRYVDGQVALRATLERSELAASFGLRGGQQLPTLPANRRTWGGASAIWWATPRFGIVAAAGSYPVDFTQGFPGGRYLSLGARIRSLPALPPVRAPREEGVETFTARRLATGVLDIRVLAPGARSVDISGDFTRWDAVPMRSAGDGWWMVQLPVGRGLHEVTVRVDGGRWLVPPGTTARRDEFGGVAGVFQVP